MSAVNQQEDVADSAKEDDNCLVSTPTPDNQGGSSIDAVEQAITDDISSKANIDQGETKSLCDFDKCADDSNDLKVTSIAADVKCIHDKYFQVNADEIKIVAKNIVHKHKQSLANSIEKPNLLVLTGYKETVIDDVSDSDFELIWTDEEGDDHNAQPLSDEALKKLDIELGIANEENSEETSQKKSQKVAEFYADNIMKVQMSKKIICEKAKAGKTFSDNSFDPNNILDHLNYQKTNEIDTNMPQPNDEIITDNEYSLETKIVHDTELKNVGVESTDPLQPKNSEFQHEISDQTNAVKNIEKQVEICDIDQTMLDFKTMADHDDNIIKQPGINKSDNESVEKVGNELLSKSIKKDNINVPSDVIIEDIKVQPMDVSPEFENLAFDTITMTSNSSLQNKEDIITPLPETNIDSQVLTANQNMEFTLENDSHLNGGKKVSNEPNFERNDILVDIPQNSDIELNIQSPKEVEENHSSDSNMTMKKNDLDIEIFNTTAKTSNYPTPDENAESSSATMEIISKCINDTEIPKLVKETKLNTENVSITVKKINFRANLDECMTPDLTSDSIKINTKHRIKRPDVMVDIPTQEFNFDTNMKIQEKPDNSLKDDTTLTSKTVTEIVNQLSKDDVECMNIDDDHNINKTEFSLDDKLLENNSTNVINKEKPSATSNQSENITKGNSDKNDGNSGNGDNLNPTVSQKENLISKENIENSDKVMDIIIEKNTQRQDNIELNSEENDENKGSVPETTDMAKAENFENVENISLSILQKDDKAMEIEKTPAEKVKSLKEVPQKYDKLTEAILTTTEKEISDTQLPTSPEASKTSPVNPDESQEVTDSLGLLAESSRVMIEDDEEPEQDEEEPEDGDGDRDDDEDFDPEDEESSNNTEELSEESNPPHSELDIQEDRIDIEFNNEADKIGLDSNDVTFDTLMGDSTDITLEENDADAVATTTVAATKDVKEKSESTEKLAEIFDPKPQPLNLLASLLTKPAAEMNPINSRRQTPSIVTKAQQISEANRTESPALGGDGPVTEVATEHKAKEKSKITEIFNLDSDDEDKNKEVSFIEKPRESNRCINYNCTSDDTATYYLADRMTIAYYGAARKRRRPVCLNCLEVVTARNEGLVSGIKDLRPLMSLRMARPTHTLLEISDSDSEGEDEPVGEEVASILEDNLTDMINDVWSKYNMDERLKHTEDYLEAELQKMEKQSEEVDRILKECQIATDKLRVDFYSSFEGPRKHLPALSIIDTPIASYACLETEEIIDEAQLPLRYPKRRSTTAADVPTKKAAFEDKRTTRSTYEPEAKPDDDKDISVVRLSAEAAPPDLPPPGEPSKPPLRVGAQVYAMKNQYGAWLRGKVLDILSKSSEQIYTMCRIRFEHKVKNPCKQLSARSIAYTEPCEVRMVIGTRVIALFKNSDNAAKRGEFYYSGVIAEVPNPVNLYRYLVFFDDGYAQYVEHKHTRLVYESKALVWEEVHPFSRDFVCNYLMKYPERPMVRMHAGQAVTVEWNGKWWDTKVLSVDAALVHVQFPDERTEWIYRGSTRLQPLFTELQQARRGDRSRMPRSTKANTKANVPYVEYTRSTDDHDRKAEQSADDLRRQRSVAKKSTTIAQQISSAATDGVVSRVVFYTPKNSVRPNKMVTHTCGPQCRRSDLLSLNELRTYNPLTKPLLSGWERQIVRHKSSRAVMYRAPCGRRLRNVQDLHRYLRAIHSDMAVDLFDYNPNTHCLAEFVLNKTNVQKKDLSHGKENVPVPCVNYYDHSLPEFCSYNTERTPTSGVPLNLDPEFLCGCDCEDDCLDKFKCACWKMTQEGAKTIGIDNTNIGYYYRRLPEPLPSGIYECNSRCKCKSTCLNRVVQNPLQLKLQVFKTLNRGWGIRALNDVPKGAFICIYAGNLLTDATANLDGLNEGDEYLAELDYIEVVESMKEGYEEDVPEADKELDKKESKKSESESESDTTESDDQDKRDKTDIEDDDFQPGYKSIGVTEFNKRLRRRDKKKIRKDSQSKDEKVQTSDDKVYVKKEDWSFKKDDIEDCITISDDEEVRVSQREPSRLGAEESMTDSKVLPKYRSIRSHFGRDEACYIMDAKVQGNIGRYLNHSCSPNVFVQNVFVDTHDPRFPWVSFFALHHIRAGTELTWNYNYDIGSVPGKVLYCYCGAPNCRGRLL